MATATEAPAVIPRLKERYEREIRPMLVERFEYGSVMQAARLVKIVLNMGVGEAKTDSKQIEAATEQLATIAGQRPNVRQARRSIAGFKIRDGMPIGVAVTLRDARMWEFLDRLISVALPRVRDFRGLSPRSFDGRGNYALGVREQIIFPEVDYDSIDQVRGLDVAITTTAATDLEAFTLLEALGMPFAREGRPGGDRPVTESTPDEEERRKVDARERVEAEQSAYAELREEQPEAYAGPDASPVAADGDGESDEGSA